MDENGRSALHHAVDATSYSWRAMRAAKALLEITPKEVLNSRATGSQPRGYTCLHFARDSSDTTYGRKDLARALVHKKANLEETEANCNTPFLLASGTGVQDIVETLISLRADVHAVNNRGLGAIQRGLLPSGSVAGSLSAVGLQRPYHWLPGDRQRAGESDSRQTRHMRNNPW